MERAGPVCFFTIYTFPIGAIEQGTDCPFPSLINGPELCEVLIRMNIILSDFLATHKAEVIDVVLTEYNEKAVMDAIAKENKAEGRKTVICHCR